LPHKTHLSKLYRINLDSAIEMTHLRAHNQSSV
jgi:hypothetical protein